MPFDAQHQLGFGLVLATFLVFAMARTSAQKTSAAEIPFSFSADQQDLPAGIYGVRLFPTDRLVSLFNRKSGRQALLPVRLESDRAIQIHGRLVFQRKGNHAILTQIWFASESIHVEFQFPPKSLDRTKLSQSFEVPMK